MPCQRYGPLGEDLLRHSHDARRPGSAIDIDVDEAFGTNFDLCHGVEVCQICGAENRSMVPRGVRRTDLADQPLMAALTSASVVTSASGLIECANTHSPYSGGTATTPSAGTMTE